MSKGPKVLIFDIETLPLEGYFWNIWDQNIGLNMIKADWSVLSYAAKFLGEKKMYYADQRKAKDIRDDRLLLKGMWDLLDAADIVITQNGDAFDIKKLNARFAINGMKPPSSYKRIDTKKIAKKHFGFTSNKLEYMSEKLGTKFKKLKHKKFPGFEMWDQCMKGNLAAYKEMELYNKHDVLATEEVYKKLQPWDATIDFNMYYDQDERTLKCNCGSTKFRKNGHAYYASGKFQRYDCTSCGSEYIDRNGKMQRKGR